MAESYPLHSNGRLKLGDSFPPNTEKGQVPAPSFKTRSSSLDGIVWACRTRPWASREAIWAQLPQRKVSKAADMLQTFFFSFCGGEEADLFSGIPDGKLRVMVEVARDRLQLNTRTNFLTVGMCLPSCLRRE